MLAESAVPRLVGSAMIDVVRGSFPFPIKKRERNGPSFATPSSKPAIGRENAMPGINFDRIRNEITMEQVLALIGFEPTKRSGDQWYGHCPLDDCSSTRHRAFSVNVVIRAYCCHQCQSKGNHIHLWAAYTEMQVYPAVIELCRALGREVPWIWRW